MKVVGNTFILHMVEALAEALVLAEKSGLGADSLHAWIDVMYQQPYTSYCNRLKNGDYYLKAPYFGSRLVRKDYRHAKSLADRYGVQVKGLDVQVGIYKTSWIVTEMRARAM